MQTLSDKTLKKLHITVIASFAALLVAVYVVSAVWGGVAHTGGGLPIPDTGLTLPVLLFLLVAAAQIVAAALQKPLVGIVLAAVKGALFIFAVLRLCLYALGAVYMQDNADAGFYSNVTYTACVVASLAVGALALICELAVSIFAKVREGKARSK